MGKSLHSWFGYFYSLKQKCSVCFWGSGQKILPPSFEFRSACWKLFKIICLKDNTIFVKEIFCFTGKIKIFKHSKTIQTQLNISSFGRIPVTQHFIATFVYSYACYWFYGDKIRARAESKGFFAPPIPSPQSSSAKGRPPHGGGGGTCKVNFLSPLLHFTGNQLFLSLPILLKWWKTIRDRQLKISLTKRGYRIFSLSHECHKYPIFMRVKGTLQRDGSGRNQVHSIGRH